jgi:Serine/threonine protein phosphatase
MKIVSGAATDTGQVREGNEDSYLVDRRLELFAIADGMGGHRAGEVASATALEGLQAAVDSGISVAGAVGRANTAVWDKASGDTSLAGMGTTLTAAWSDGTTMTVAHVGDSRAYLLRADALQRVTVDHSLVEELIRDGKLTEEQAAVHPQRSIITRALGVDSSVDVDVYSLVLQPNDRVMLCSDGLTSMVRANGIAEILRRESDPTAAANALVDAANEAGGDDNITVVVLDALADGIDPLPRSVAAAINPMSTNAAAAVPDTGNTEIVAPAAITVVTTSTSLDATGADAAAVEPPPEHLPRDTARYRDPKAGGRHTGRRVGRGVWRVLLFAVPILIIVGVALGTIRWYAQNSYFVAFDKNDQVVIYRGRPGGLLFWDPEVVDATHIRKATLTPLVADKVQNRKDDFNSEREAKAFLKRGSKPTPTSSTTTTSTTTTTPSNSTGSP